MTQGRDRAPETSFSARRLLPLVVLGLGLVAFFAFGIDDYVSLGALRDHRSDLVSQVERYGFAAGIAYIFVYAVVVAFSIPGGALLTITAGFLFGTLAGTFYVVLGATLGATALFLAARTALGDVLERKAGAALKKMEAGFRENALSYLLVLRLIPVFPFWLVNLVPALLGVPLRIYVLGTFFGIIPGTFVYASVGRGLGAIFDAGETPDLGIIFKPEVLLPLAGLAVLALLPVLYKLIKTQSRSSG